MIMYIVEDEKVVGHHIVLNEMEMMQQLGVLPAATPAEDKITGGLRPARSP